MLQYTWQLRIQWVEKMFSSYHTVNAKLNFFSYFGPFLEELASPLSGLFWKRGFFFNSSGYTVNRENV